MNAYSKSWTQKVVSEIGKDWTQFSTPMSLKIKEDTQSVIFISANLAFNNGHRREIDKKHQGSLYYRILVNGEKLVEYHVIDPSNENKKSDINLHAVSDIPAGESTVEVYYKTSKNGAWDLLEQQNRRELSVLSFPKLN
ncbi:hypothetical protein [Lutimonas sp.]|uniref:hypothetical protein n=1 Tax=Lutimonas sp. TaxID=1872403 RepID=UPI003D9B91B0